MTSIQQTQEENILNIQFTQQNSTKLARPKKLTPILNQTSLKIEVFKRQSLNILDHNSKFQQLKELQQEKTTYLDILNNFQCEITEETDDKSSSNHSTIDVSSSEQSFVNEKDIVSPLTTQFQQKYEIVESLGKGRFGVVYLVKSSQESADSQSLYAAKQIELDNNEEQIEKEWDLINSLNNKYIIKGKELIIDLKDNKATLVMEYFEGCSLLSLIKNDFIFENDALLIIKQLLEALSYLHTQNIIHRDISLENVLYNRKTKQIKLIDFGISKKLIKNNDNEEDSEDNENNCFSPTSNDLYKCPELYEFQAITTAMDMYACGLVFISLLLKKCVYANRNGFKKRLNEIENENIRTIASKMVMKKPEDRITAQQAILSLF